MTGAERLRQRQSAVLLRWGMVLLLLGLVTGLTLPVMANPRMGLSSHLEGVMNGMLLMVLGLVWPRLRLSEAALRAGFRLLLFGAFANWMTTFVAGLVGAGEKMMPLAGAGHRGAAIQEGLIAASLVLLCVAILTACVIVLWGLRGDPARSDAPPDRSPGDGKTG